MNIFTQFFKRGQKNPAEKKREITQDLMRREAQINKDIFGPTPAGTRREFFYLEKNTWVWFEEWRDDTGERQQATTRYVIRPNEIVKSRNGGQYQSLSIEEAKNFKQAIKKYVDKVSKQLYTVQQPNKK